MHDMELLDTIQCFVLLADGDVVGIWLQRQNRPVSSYYPGQQKSDDTLVCPNIKYTGAFLQAAPLQQCQFGKFRPVVVVPGCSLGIGYLDVECAVSINMGCDAPPIPFNAALNTKQAELRPESMGQDLSSK